MVHVPGISSAREALCSSASQSFQTLPVVLHREIASCLHACEALAVGATEQRMQTLYPASITDMVVRPQLFSDYAGQESLNACDWEAYLTRHSVSLAGLLARLPCLNVLTAYSKQEEVVEQALFLQPCPQVVDLDTKYKDPQGVMLHDFPEQSEFEAPYPLYLAMEKGHLPSWNKLYVEGNPHLPILTQALQAGHLNRVKELEIWECNHQPSHLQLLLGALKAREGKLEAVKLEVNLPDDLTTRLAMQGLSPPQCAWSSASWNNTCS